MKAVVVEAPRRYGLQEVPYPKPGKGEVVLRVSACCVCATDIHLLRGEIGNVEYPLIPGHEFAGRVVEVGEGVSEVAPGDRVSASPMITCGHCYFCRAGREIHCRNGHVIGHSRSREVRLDGAFAEYVTLPQRNAIRLADGLPDEEAAFIPNLSTVVYALRRARLRPGEQICIFGTGTMAILFVQAAKASGATLVAISGHTEARLAKAQEMGAHLTLRAGEGELEVARKVAPYGFDVVVDAVGRPEIVEKAFAFVKDEGRVVLFGIAAPSERVSLSPFEIFWRNLEVIGSRSSLHSAQTAHDLLACGAVKVGPLISHRFPLERFDDAIATASDPSRSMRVIVNP